MFSGIIEARSEIQKVEVLDQALRITVTKPEEFNDLKTGDSIATDGVCLTIEQFNSEIMTFVLGFETLKVLNRNEPNDWQGRVVNLERSLRFGDRVHGHLVTGHVEGMGRVTKSHALGDSWFLQIAIPNSLVPFCWKKGSLTINGVSLTINEFEKQKENLVEVCLIPETLARTNLGTLKENHLVTLEPDYMARAIFHGIKNGVIEVNHVQ